MNLGTIPSNASHRAFTEGAFNATNGGPKSASNAEGRRVHEDEKCDWAGDDVRHDGRYSAHRKPRQLQKRQRCLFSEAEEVQGMATESEKKGLTLKSTLTRGPLNPTVGGSPKYRVRNQGMERKVFMVLIFVLVFLIVVFVALAFVGWKLFDDGRHDGVGLLAFFLSIVGTVTFAIWLLIATVQIIGAPTKAALLNQQFGTHYTADDIFWGSDIIGSVIQGQRNRIDLTTQSKN